jgi:dephospho-CoA kinase
MKWTGLTGGIATGKSTAKKLIEGLGYPVVDADQISHRLTEPGGLGYHGIVSQFGREILVENSDRIDRKKLAAKVFSSLPQREILENILHPLIQKQVHHERELHKLNSHKICFYDVPLLFEKNLQSQFDTTLLIWCDPATQLQRLMNRNGLTEDEARIRIGNQMSMVEKVKLANHCIDNSGDENDLEKQLKRLLPTLIL